MKLLNAAFYIALLGWAAVTACAGADPVAEVTGGQIRGRLIPGRGAAFKGVPFSQPPVSELRWRDPEPVKPWTGVRDSRAFGPICTQPVSRSNHAQAQGEDCLYLNVWTPEWPAAPRKPVMLWLYGGSNIGGSGEEDYLDGTSLSRRGVVIVTMNFRLGVFGFLAHPGLTAESPHYSSGNYGLLDQLAALRWVHENIAKFGGDPGNVTLFGQSSGGMDTAFLVASPLSKGLIHRAIQESGPPVREFEPMKVTEQRGVKFAAAMKAPAGDADAIRYLRSLPAAESQKAAVTTKADAPGTVAITEIDGYLIHKYTALAYQDGADLPIPMIVGNNAREQTHSYKPESMKKWIRDNFGSLAPQAEEFYGWANGGTGKDDPFFGPSGVQITADTRQRCPAIAQSIWRSSHGHATYEYLFDPPIAGETFTRHIAEVPFVFGNLLPLGAPLGGPYTDADRKISDQIQTYWVNFARTGNPNGDALPEWPKFNATTRPYLEFTIQDGPVVRENLRRNICDLYIKALKETIPANTAAYPE
jgi:para-nitrobenzyl esterase